MDLNPKGKKGWGTRSSPMDIPAPRTTGTYTTGGNRQTVVKRRYKRNGKEIDQWRTHGFDAHPENDIARTVLSFDAGNWRLKAINGTGPEMYSFLKKK